MLKVTGISYKTSIAQINSDKRPRSLHTLLLSQRILDMWSRSVFAVSCGCFLQRQDRPAVKLGLNYTAARSHVPLSAPPCDVPLLILCVYSLETLPRAPIYSTTSVRSLWPVSRSIISSPCIANHAPPLPPLHYQGSILMKAQHSSQAPRH